MLSTRNIINLKERKSGMANKNKLYYLHSKVKKEGFRLSTKDKTIYVRYMDYDKLSDSIIKLRDLYGYGVQLEIV